MGYPQMDGLFHGKSHLEMDDDWGYPYFRKPPRGDLVGGLNGMVISVSKWRKL